MNFFRTGKFRLLYLLALVQLVGGPLVLLQVTVFCKMTLRESPQTGLAKATSRAWNSQEFQSALIAADPSPARASDQADLASDPIQKAPGKKSPTGDPLKSGLEKSKLPITPWRAAPVILAVSSSHCGIIDRTRTWTPAWPQAPPGPPPRVA